MTVLALVTWLATHGCGAPCAAGVIANLTKESRLDPCASGPSGIGLSQWAGTRRHRLIATLGKHWCDDGIRQMEFMWTELREMRLLDRLLRATDPALAAKLFMLDYERPRNRNPRARMALARELFEGIRYGAYP